MHIQTQGTIVVILGVIGIVAFGSINSGLGTETDVEHITYLWRRGGWLGFFFMMAISLLLLSIFTSKLDGILSDRGDISSVPFAGMGARAVNDPRSAVRRNRENTHVVIRAFMTVKTTWDAVMLRIVEILEHWTAAKDDMTIAWTLGIGWACCGGGLAGGCLVFAKAMCATFPIWSYRIADFSTE
jgi:hypothetical protein